MRLAQEVTALHLALAGPLDDPHDLAPVLVPAVTFGMVLQPAMDELGGPLGEALFLHQSAGRLLWGFSQTESVVLRNQSTLPLSLQHDDHRRSRAPAAEPGGRELPRH